MQRKAFKGKSVHEQTLPLVGIGTLPSLILFMQILILYSNGSMAHWYSVVNSAFELCTFNSNAPNNWLPCATALFHSENITSCHNYKEDVSVVLPAIEKIVLSDEWLGA